MHRARLLTLISGGTMSNPLQETCHRVAAHPLTSALRSVRSQHWRSTMRLVPLLAVVAVWLAMSGGVAAQSQITTAVIDGTVVDPSGAALPGVDVEVRNVETGLVRSLTADRDGRFVALQLPPGRYTVTLKLSGFATLVQENVLITVGETVRLNPVMKVSGIAETVTVTAESPAIDLSRSAAASTLDQTTVESTPILGRKFEDL